MNAISIHGLNKWYGKFHAIKNVSFDIEEGEFFGYLGPNGAGKTTTINTIIGLSNFNSGSIKVFGNDVVSEYRKTRSMIGVSQQEFNFDPFLTVREILIFQGGYYGMGRSELESRVDELLKAFNLASKKDASFRQISGGMKRRLQLAKALVHDPKILILDEPTTGVDVDLRHALWKYFTELNKEGKTIILTTHYIEEAEQLCDRIGVINNGRMVALDTKENLIQKMSEQTIELYLVGKIKTIPKGLSDFRCRIRSEGNILLITCKDAQHVLPKAIQVLSRKGIEINKINTVRDRLEDIYLRLTKGEKNELDRI